MLSLAYEAKYIFSTIRSPMTYEFEWREMPEDPDETEGRRRRRGSFFAILKRIDAHKDFFERVWKLHPRCMAAFGQQADEIFLLLHHARREIEVSAQMLMGDREGVERELIREWERDVWEMGNARQLPADRVGEKLTAFKERTEQLCRPIVDRGLKPPRAWAFWAKERRMSASGGTEIDASGSSSRRGIDLLRK